MTIAAVVTLIYGLLLIVGGVMGSAQAGSQVSLYAGAGTGVLALIAAVLIWRGQSAGLWLAAILALALALFGFYFWVIAKYAFMPRGLIFVLSVVELAVVLPMLFNVSERGGAFGV